MIHSLSFRCTVRCIVHVFMLVVWMLSSPSNAEDTDRLVLRGSTAMATFTLSGGGFIEFRMNDKSLNPLNWEVSSDSRPGNPVSPRPQGHFLCLDRWGAPSKAELAKGIPFHGEAPHVRWQIKEALSNRVGQLNAAMTCALPLAGIEVERKIELEANSAVLVVSESVKNVGSLGRIYNVVQHPTIAPPFLNESTIVNSNASFGFSQDGPIPRSNQEAVQWPHMRIGDQVADLSQFRGDSQNGTEARSDVSSFVFADDVKIGWVTAFDRKSRLLLGYCWQTSDYPWLNIWRFRKGASVLARGLEFGTTGYHQPFPILVKQHRILDRRLYEHIDADETQSRSYIAFLANTPEDFRGVLLVSHADGAIQIQDEEKRVIRVALSKLPWDLP